MADKHDVVQVLVDEDVRDIRHEGLDRERGSEMTTVAVAGECGREDHVTTRAQDLG